MQMATVLLLLVVCAQGQHEVKDLKAALAEKTQEIQDLKEELLVAKAKTGMDSSAGQPKQRIARKNRGEKTHVSVDALGQINMAADDSVEPSLGARHPGNLQEILDSVKVAKLAFKEHVARRFPGFGDSNSDSGSGSGWGSSSSSSWGACFPHCGEEFQKPCGEWKGFNWSGSGNLTRVPEDQRNCTNGLNDDMNATTMGEVQTCCRQDCQTECGEAFFDDRDLYADCWPAEDDDEMTECIEEKIVACIEQCHQDRAPTCVDTRGSGVSGTTKWNRATGTYDQATYSNSKCRTRLDIYKPDGSIKRRRRGRKWCQGKHGNYNDIGCDYTCGKCQRDSSLLEEAPKEPSKKESPKKTDQQKGAGKDKNTD